MLSYTDTFKGNKPYKLVAAFDPGITTGYANGLIDGLRYPPELGINSGQRKWNELELYEELTRTKPDIIIYESFEYRNSPKRRDNVELFPRNLIGVINLYVHQRAKADKSCGLYVQSPATGKSYYSDTILKKLNVYKIANPHANDATRHLLQWWTYGAGFQYHNGKGTIRNLA